MRHLPLRTLTLVAATAIATVLAGCGSSGGSSSGSAGSGANGSSGKLRTVQVGAIPIVDDAPLYVGVKQGFFVKHGIKLKISTAQGGAAIVPGVISGQFQFGFVNMTSVILAVSKGLPLTVVAPGVFANTKTPDYSAIMVKKGSSIKTAKDLEGKTVSVNTLKNIGDTTVRESVRKAGGDPSKVKFVELAFPDMPAALENGRIDAAWVVEPFETILLGQGARVVAYNFFDTAPDLMVASYVASKKLEKSDPGLVKDFAAAMDESLKYSQDHTDEARKITGTYTKIPQDVLSKMIMPQWSTTINRESTQKLVDLALKDGLISKKVDLSSFLPQG